MQCSFYKECKRRQKRCVLLKRMQKKARTLRSFEKNACPTLVFFPNKPNICLNWFSLLIKRCVRVCISIFLSSFFLFFPFSSFFLSLFSIPSYNFLPVFFPYSFFSFIILSFLNLPFFSFLFSFLISLITVRSQRFI